MKKLLAILAICLLPGVAWGASYYGCASAAINADSTFCATPSGSCAGSDPVTAATALAGTHNLYANGCTISFADADFTAALISTADGDGVGAAVAGGGFTLATGTAAGNTYTTNITAGTTTCLTISGNGAGTPVNTIVGTITGGTVTSAYGVDSSHTVGTINVTGGILGGSGNYTNMGWRQTGTGPVTLTGNCTGVSGPGCRVVGATVFTVNGNCVGSNTVEHVGGCQAREGELGYYVVTGKIISGTKASGLGAQVWFTPAATDYIILPKDASYTRDTVDGHATEMPTNPGAANVRDATAYGSFTGSMAAGGGAWAQ